MYGTSNWKKYIPWGATFCIHILFLVSVITFISFCLWSLFPRLIVFVIGINACSITAFFCLYLFRGGNNLWRFLHGLLLALFFCDHWRLPLITVTLHIPTRHNGALCATSVFLYMNITFSIWYMMIIVIWMVWQQLCVVQTTPWHLFCWDRHTTLFLMIVLLMHRW